MGKLIDLTGQKFGRLTVIERAENKGKHTIWKCKCECGNVVDVYSTHLIQGFSTSCGCIRTELVKGRSVTHGKSKTRLNNVYHTMLQRCYNKNNSCFHKYGARGITVCDEWRHSFEAFYDWSMENGYDENAQKGECTLDRIDNSKGYSPDNCRWATSKEQACNRRSNHLITYNGKTQTLSQWADELGMSRSTLNSRINQYHWTIERAFGTP